MFCRQCGNQIPDGAKFCQACGTPVAAAAQPVEQVNQQPAQQAYAQPYQQPYQQPAQQVYPQYANTPGVADHAAVSQGYGDPKYKTLGGWLLFFVIIMILGVVGSIASVISTNAEWSQYSQYAASLGMGAYNTFFMVWSVLVVIECLLNVGLIALIIMRNDIFLKYYQIICIVDLVLSVIIMVYAGSLPNVGDSMTSISSSMISGILGAIVGFILMTMYYCKSVRVRTYMGSTSYIDKALIKIGV